MAGQFLNLHGEMPLAAEQSPLSHAEGGRSRLASLCFDAFGCQNSVVVAGDFNDRTCSTILSRVRAEALRIQAKYSRYVPNSALSIINAGAFRATVAIDPETRGLLNVADEAHRSSEGVFDVTSGVFRKAWNFSAKQVPSAENLAEILPLVGWDKVHLSSDGIRFDVDGMEIDFGGIGKEYAVDCAISLLRESGVNSALVNFGGDTATIGTHPSGRPWRLGIAHPRKENAMSEVMFLQDSALATSGDYQRAFIFDGVRYCHLLNPRTGMPKTSFASASVCAPSCLVAGVLSTSAMLMERESAIYFLSELGLEALTIDDAGLVTRFGLDRRQLGI